MNIFDILGPVMVGPSSSHTAGAVRIGYTARKLLQDKPVEVKIGLHGSFADTGTGHGTDRALIAGLLGMRPDDTRIPDSFEIAEQQGLVFSFEKIRLKDAHPNTALLTLRGESGHCLEIQAASVGGGRIMIRRLDGIEISFSLEKPTLIVNNEDKPGYVAKVAALLSEEQINMASMQLYRNHKTGQAIMVLETDQSVSEAAVSSLAGSEGILKAAYFNSEEV